MRKKNKQALRIWENKNTSTLSDRYIKRRIYMNHGGRIKYSEITNAMICAKREQIYNERASKNSDFLSLNLAIKQCSTCGKYFHSYHPKAICCSDICYYNKYCLVMPEPRLYVCSYCGREFIRDKYHNQGNKYCSDICSRRSGAYKRKTRERGAFIEHINIGYLRSRDHGKCQICGKPIKWDVVVPHPMAFTMDHIVPISMGGKHEHANVQCAHFICNSRKGNKGAGDQLRLC